MMSDAMGCNDAIASVHAWHVILVYICLHDVCLCCNACRVCNLVHACSCTFVCVGTFIVSYVGDVHVQHTI